MLVGILTLEKLAVSPSQAATSEDENEANVEVPKTAILGMAT